MDSNIRKKYNETMDSICQYIKNYIFTLDHIKMHDGRLVSAKGEEEIIKIVKRYVKESPNIEFVETKIRDWRDFELVLENKWHLPVNIKLTSPNSKGIWSNDNVSSKEGLIWTFTQEEPQNRRTWSSLKNAMKTPKIKSNRDYYFLIVNKTDLNDIWYTSFKQMCCIKINGNNMPFQANWNKNRKLSNQTDLDAFKKLFNAFYGSLEKLKKISTSLDNLKDKFLK